MARIKNSGQVPQYGQGSTVGSLIGTGVGALGFIGGPQLAAMTIPLGQQLGAQIGSKFDKQTLETNPIQAMPQNVEFNQGQTQNIYAMGGMPGGINSQMAEVEKQEVMKTPSGQTMIADAPSHSNGGLQLPLPAGTQITSDRLVNPNTGNTFANDQAKLERMKNKIEKKDFRSNDKYTKNAVKILTAASDKIFQAQEAMKMPQPLVQNQFSHGGFVYGGGVMKYPEGGFTGIEDNWGGLNNGLQYQSQQPAMYQTQTGGTPDAYGEVTNLNYQKPAFKFNMSQPNAMKGVTLPNMKPINQLLSTPEAPVIPNESAGIPYGNIGLGLGVANMAGQFIQSMNPEKIERLDNKYEQASLNNYNNALQRERGLRYDNTDMLTNVKNSELSNNAAIDRNISGPGRIAYRMANRATSLDQQNRIYGDTNRQNLGIQQGANRMQLGLSELQNNFGQQNANYQKDYRDMNLQQKAALRKIRSQATADGSSMFQQVGRDEELMDLLPQMYPNANPVIFKRGTKKNG